MAGKGALIQSLLPEILRAAGKMDRSMKDKLYWIFHRIKKQALGPYSAKGLAKLKFFRPESRIAPYGSLSKSDWKLAKDYPELRPYLEKKKD